MHNPFDRQGQKPMGQRERLADYIRGSLRGKDPMGKGTAPNVGTGGKGIRPRLENPDASVAPDPTLIAMMHRSTRLL